jgi:hypothetical protein
LDVIGAALGLHRCRAAAGGEATAPRGVMLSDGLGHNQPTRRDWQTRQLEGNFHGCPIWQLDRAHPQELSRLALCR